MAASGYDTRSGGQSFAFQSGSPAQSNGQLNTNAPDAGVVGGNSGGGVERASPMTYADGNDGIPQFLQGLVEPYVKAKQQEKFDQGMDAAANGKAISEISKSDSGISKIFGPSYYHQGAAMYTANTAVAKFHADALVDDNLYKLDEAGRTKALSDKSRDLLTGDVVTDHLIQTGLMTNRGPLVATLAKKNYDWGQQQAVHRASQYADQAGDLYQGLSVANAGLSSPDDPSHAAMTQATGTFLGSFQKPYGMSDESYQGFVAHSAAAMRAKGNFAGYEAMQKGGLFDVLTDDQKDKLISGYDTDASKVLGDATSSPDVNRAMSTMDAKIKFGGYTSPKHIYDDAQAINAQVAAKTGITGKQLISGKDIEGLQNEMASGQFSAGLRLQSRQWQIADREAEWKHTDDKSAEKAAAALLAANTAMSAGNVSTALAVGSAKSDDVNLAFQAQMAKGNFAPMLQNFKSGHYVNEYVASQVQSAVANSIGSGLTKGFEAAHQQWQQLNAGNPAAATAYFGTYGGKMLAYDNYVKGGETPLSAYAQSFGKPDSGGRPDLPAGVKEKDVIKTITSSIGSNDKWAFGLLGTRAPLNASSLSMTSNVLLPKVATFMHDSGQDAASSTGHVLATMQASGEIERAGGLTWNNPGGARKIGNYLGLPDEATDTLVSGVINQKLIKAGYSDGASGDNVSVMRYSGADGQPMLYVQAFPKDGSSHTDVSVSMHDLQALNRQGAKAALLAAQPRTLTPIEFQGLPAAR